MPQVEAVATLVKGVGESVLYTALEREKEKNPEATPEEVLRKVATHLVPATVPGSPEFHRQGLQDLLAIVAKRGLPSFFLTLTADEASELRWPEVKEFEKMLNDMQWHEGWTWKDMPVEMGTLFYERVQMFLHKHLLCKDNPLLGRLEAYTIRFESQVRSCPGIQSCGMLDAAKNACIVLQHLEAHT